MGTRNTSGVRKETRGGKPHWICDFYYIDRDGRQKRYRRDATIQSSAGAHAEVERLRGLLAKHGTLEPRQAAPTFRQFVEGDFERLFMPRYRPATRVRYTAVFRQGLLDALGSKRLDEIGTPAFRAYGAELANRHVQVKPALALARSVLRAAVEIGKLERMPELPKLFKDSRKLPDAPSEEEIGAMLSVATGWLRVGIALAAFAGLRSGEVRALEAGDVSLARSVINVRRALSEDEPVTPKSGNERIVPLSPELQQILAGAMRGKLTRARVVVTEQGESPSRQLLLHRLRRLQEQHGLRVRTFHSLRHFFCSTLIRRGASLEAVRLLAGHTKLDVTQRYVHAQASDLAAAIAKFPPRIG